MPSTRTIKIKKNIIGLFLIKGGSILISFFYVPLLLNALNSIEYGIWLTLTSIVSWLIIMDIGIGNGLRNRLTESITNDDILKAKKYISTAYICMFSMVLIVSFLFILINSKIPWTSILNASSMPSAQLNKLVLVVVLGFCYQFGFGLINSILLALQRTAASSFIGFIGQLCSFIAVFILVKILHINSILILGSVISFIPVLILIISTIIFFSVNADISPSTNYFEKTYMRDIFSLGMRFFILQIITMILFYSNNLIITHSIGNEAVVEYNIAYKYMNCLNMIFTIIATPIWSATTEAYTLHDYNWISNINKRLLKIVGILSIIGIIMLILSSYFYKIWLRDNYINISFTTSALLLIYTIFLCLYGCYGYILNGMGKLKIQIIATIILSIAYIPLAYISGCKFGINGILTIFAINQIFNFIWSKIQYDKIIKGTATGLWCE